MLKTLEIDAGGNDGVGVDDTEGILPVHRELKVVHGITCHGIYESEGCEFVYTVTSQALSYPTCRLGLVVLDMRGFLDRGFSSCAVPAFCHGPGISRDRRVYARPMSRWEAARSKDEAGEFPEVREEE